MVFLPGASRRMPTERRQEKWWKRSGGWENRGTRILAPRSTRHLNSARKFLERALELGKESHPRYDFMPIHEDRSDIRRIFVNKIFSRGWQNGHTLQCWPYRGQNSISLRVIFFLPSFLSFFLSLCCFHVVTNWGKNKIDTGLPWTEYYNGPMTGGDPCFFPLPFEGNTTLWNLPADLALASV